MPRPTRTPARTQARTAKTSPARALPASVLLALGLVLSLGPPATGATPPGLFVVDGRTPVHAVAMARHAEPPDVIPGSAMLRRVAGVLAELTSRDLAQLRRSVNTRTRVPEDVRVREHLATLHLFAHGGSSRVELARVEHGWIMARSPETGAAVRLDEHVVAPMLSDWGRPIPDPPPDQGEPGEPVAHPGPHTPSPIRLDEATATARFGRGGRSPFADPMTRDLSRERFTIRRPLGHRADRPVGLLVWISPENEAEIPETIFEAADTMGLICITPADAGDDRSPLDRFQLALDAVATASASWWINSEQVYIAGLSGGARVASTLLTSFPDVFRGAVCVAGLDSHHRVGIGDGRFWPKSHERPAGGLGRLLTERRVAVITGPREINFNEIRGRSRMLQREGLPVRVFDFPDQLHDMPTPERVGEAVRWVDSPRAEAFEASAEEARGLLDRYLARRGEAGPEDEADTRLLERVTVVGPWTEPAWHAARLLGYETGGGP